MTPNRAILDLKIQRDKLHQYQKRIAILTTREHDLAREALARRDRRAALLALRRKKYQETLLSRTDDQLAQLEQLTQDVEFALVQKDVYFGLKQGTDVMKEIGREMGGLEGVERLVGESDRERKYQREVEELLDGKMSVNDEEEVEGELAGLEEKIVDREPQRPKETNAVAAQNMPNVPESNIHPQEEPPSVPDSNLKRAIHPGRNTEDAANEAVQPMPA